MAPPHDLDAGTGELNLLGDVGGWTAQRQQFECAVATGLEAGSPGSSDVIPFVGECLQVVFEKARAAADASRSACELPYPHWWSPRASADLRSCLICRKLALSWDCASRQIWEPS